METCHGSNIIGISNFSLKRKGGAFQKGRSAHIHIDLLFFFINSNLFLKNDFENFRVPPFLFRENLKNIELQNSNDQVRGQLVHGPSL